MCHDPCKRSKIRKYFLWLYEVHLWNPLFVRLVHLQWELHFHMLCIVFVSTFSQALLGVFLIHNKFLNVKINTKRHKRNVKNFHGLWIDCLTFYLHHFELLIRRPSVLDHMVITSVQYDLVDESAQFLQSHLTAGPPGAENENSTNKWAQNISMLQILVNLYSFFRGQSGKDWHFFLAFVCASSWLDNLNQLQLLWNCNHLLKEMVTKPIPQRPSVCNGWRNLE